MKIEHTRDYHLNRAAEGSEFCAYCSCLYKPNGWLEYPNQVGHLEIGQYPYRQYYPAGLWGQDIHTYVGDLVRYHPNRESISYWLWIGRCNVQIKIVSGSALDPMAQIERYKKIKVHSWEIDPELLTADPVWWPNGYRWIEEMRAAMDMATGNRDLLEGLMSHIAETANQSHIEQPLTTALLLEMNQRLKKVA